MDGGKNSQLQLAATHGTEGVHNQARQLHLISIYIQYMYNQYTASSLTFQCSAIVYKLEKGFFCIELTEVTFWCVVALPPGLAPHPFASGILPIVDTSALLPLSGSVLRKLLTRWQRHCAPGASDLERGARTRQVERKWLCTSLNQLCIDQKTFG